MAGQESRECCIFYFNVEICGIYLSLTLGLYLNATREEQLQIATHFLSCQQNALQVYGESKRKKYFNHGSCKDRWERNLKENKNFRKFDSFQLRFFGKLELGTSNKIYF